MDYIYIIELVILASVIIGLIAVNYFMVSARKAKLRAVVQLHNTMDSRLVELNDLMDFVKDRGQELAMFSSTLQSYIKQYPRSINHKTSRNKGTILPPPLPSDPRELAANGELKRKYFGSASYLDFVHSTVNQLSSKTQSYLKEIYHLIAQTDQEIVAESKVIVALQQEITHYIEIIQSTISGDENELINSVDQKLIHSLSKLLEELSLLNSHQVEAQSVTSALHDALGMCTK
ncbi:MAG: hypothetical protein KAH22_01550 [Thiotrichaceae bacterium]|nr:hypothetical protein [Thiotrichaceae bacterium]